MAKLYTHAPSGWELERGSGLPFLARDGRRAWVKERPGTSFGIFPSGIRREILWVAQQLSEAGGQQPRTMVTAAAKTKQARTASAVAAPRNDDSDDD